jgi:cell division protein FtsA
MNGIDNQQSAIKIDEIASPKAAVYRPVAETQDRRQEEVEEVETTSKANNAESTGDKIKKLLIAMLTRLKIFR